MRRVFSRLKRRKVLGQMQHLQTPRYLLGCVEGERVSHVQCVAAIDGLIATGKSPAENNTPDVPEATEHKNAPATTVLLTNMANDDGEPELSITKDQRL